MSPAIKQSVAASSASSAAFSPKADSAATSAASSSTPWAWDFRGLVATEFDGAFRSAYYAAMRKKLGLGFSLPNGGEGEEGGV